MTTIFANRACGILYRILKAIDTSLPFLLPANVCPVVPLTFLSAGTKFKFVDINPVTLCIDEAMCINEIRTKKYAGLMFIRTYGYVYDTNDFFHGIKSIDNSVLIIDDRCLCIPSFLYDENNADIQLYSTGYAKYVNLGKYGFAHIKDDRMANAACHVEDIAFNENIDIDKIYKEKEKAGGIIEESIEGWLDIGLMPNDGQKTYIENVVNSIEKINNHKKDINAIYLESLSHLALPLCFNDWRFNIRVRQKESILTTIFENGLFASSHYKPVNKLFGDCQEMPISTKLYEEVVNLFNDNYFSLQQAMEITNLIKKQ